MIYFAQDTLSLLIKIGFTDSPDTLKRVRSLQVGCPGQLVLLHVMPGEKVMEDILHQAFAAHRERGEWFRPHPEILSLMVESSSGGNGELAKLVHQNLIVAMRLLKKRVNGEVLTKDSLRKELEAAGLASMLETV